MQACLLPRPPLKRFSLPPWEKGFLRSYDFAHCGITLNIVRVSSLDKAELKTCTSEPRNVESSDWCNACTAL